MGTLAKIITVAFLLAAVPGWSQSPEENAAKAAEQAGKLREALTQYVSALQKAPEGSADDQRLRETVLRVARRVTPAPALPDEARRFAVRGQIAVKEAKSPADFEEAAKEFGNAIRIAPWWADGYFNQGVTLEKAGKFNEAIRSLKLYLVAAPGDAQAQKVKEQIFALEYRLERAQKESLEQQQALARTKADEDAKFGHLLGSWQFESSTQWGREMNVKLIGTLTFTHQGDAVEGRVQLRGAYFNRDYSASDDQTPKPELRGTFRRETNTIEWVSARNFPSGNCYRPVEWRPVMIQVSPDRRRITYSTPQSSLHHQTCAPTSQATRFVTLAR